MLPPNSRHLYLEALKPPLGFKLTSAVGTTFSVDLPTLLGVPLAFALMDWEDEKGNLLGNPVALLHALREHADKLVLFCQAGRIALPAKRHPLFAYLEPIIVQCSVGREDASFHPKVWLLRFVGPQGEVSYRFLCLSRNLTPDSSWDTILSLEGTLDTNRTKAIARNHPLGDFIKALPSFATKSSELTASRKAMIDQMESEVRRVKFEVPEPFKDDLQFIPFGIPGTKVKLEERVDRALIMSPFLSDSALKQLVSKPGNHVLLSRAECLDPIPPETLGIFKDVLTMDAAAEAESGDAIEGGDGDTNAAKPSPIDAYRGLHAKLFVFEQGWDAAVWTGSANATGSALGRNVEFMVRLIGPKSKVGVDAFLEGADSKAGFGRLLQPYRGVGPRDDNTALQDVEEALFAARQYLSSLEWRMNVAGAGPYELIVTCNGLRSPGTNVIEARLWPISVTGAKTEIADAITSGSATFVVQSLEAITPFLAFELVAGTGDVRTTERFVISAKLLNAPVDRNDRLLESILSNADRFRQYMLFLLSDDPDLAAASARLFTASEGNSDAAGREALGLTPLFEPMLRCFARSPEKLDAIHRVVTDLCKTDSGRALVSEDFLSAWRPIWQAHLATKASS